MGIGTVMMLRRVKVIAVLALAGAGGVAGGCRNTGGGSLNYAQAYEQRLYGEAFTKALPIAENPNAKDAERAALIAGMSAQALGQREDAKRLLTPLVGSKNADVSGRARVTLGLLAEQEGDISRATSLLRSGAERLDGDDAARAKLQAGAALERIGLREMALQQYHAGIHEADDPNLRTMLRDRSKVQPYFIQAGAFSTVQQARAEATRITRGVVRAGQPTPQVVQTNVNGRTLYAVQIGPYDDAGAARTGMALIQRQGVRAAMARR
ncbi:MAG: SPOR domain-containing protein [Phycisphaerales bacterium]|jgi:tetratricopeptide (TPR) repeat protein|nr:SPOR domain-containing protein [Phycisphaerales bacterium]